MSLRNASLLIAPRAVFFIYGEDGQEVEKAVNPVYYDAAFPPKAIWEVPGAGHTRGIETRPAEYQTPGRRLLRQDAAGRGVGADATGGSASPRAPRPRTPRRPRSSTSSPLRARTTGRPRGRSPPSAGGRACCGDESQQPMCPHTAQRRRCIHLPPVARHSSQPSARAPASRSIWSRWVHSSLTGISCGRCGECSPAARSTTRDGRAGGRKSSPSRRRRRRSSTAPQEASSSASSNWLA